MQPEIYCDDDSLTAALQKLDLGPVETLPPGKRESVDRPALLILSRPPQRPLQTMTQPQRVLLAVNDPISFDPAQWLSAGVADFLTWPCRPEELRKRVALNLLLLQKSSTEATGMELPDERYRELVARLNCGAAIYRAIDNGEDFVFLEFNQRAEQIDQLQRDAVLGRRLSEVFPMARELGFHELFKRVWQSGQAENHPVSIYQDERLQGWRENYVFRLSGGELVALYEDATEQKQAELDLVLSKERLSFALLGANSGIWDWDVQENRVFFDENYYRIAGYQPYEFPCSYQQWEERLHPDDREQALAAVGTLLEKGADSFTTSFRFRTKQGGWMWILGQGKVIRRDQQGQPVRITGMHTDISARKQAEKTLEESEQQLRTILNSIGDAVIATDFQQRIVSINRVAMKLTRWPEAAALGKDLRTVFQLLDPQSAEPLDDFIRHWPGAENGPLRLKHALLALPDGERRHVACSAAPIKDRERSVKGVVLVFRDIGEELRTREELQRMQTLESIGLLAGGLAHDFNNILMGLFGNITMAKRKLEPQHPAFANLQKAEGSAERAKNLTGKLLTFAKGGEPIRDQVSLPELIREVVQFDLSGSSVKPIFEIPAHLWIADVDKGQIQQVFSNLATNAKQAMPNGGNLQIRLQNFDNQSRSIKQLEPQKYLRVTVQDSGEGIAEQDLPKIFDPYFSTKQTGTGLGLATVYSIVHRHKGLIEVASAPGEGTCFTLLLPANAEPLQQGKAPRKKALQQIGSAHILVMDDEQMILELVTEMLQNLGHRVTTATDSQEALNCYQQQTFDLVILDLTIPGGPGGLETLQQLRQIDPQVKALVASGYAEDPVMSRCEKYGFKGVIGKPYSLEELQQAIDHALSA